MPEEITTDAAMVGTEKRANYRFRCIRTIHLIHEDKEYPCHTYDVSHGGVAIISAETLPLAEVNLEFSYAGLIIPSVIISRSPGAEANFYRYHVKFVSEIDDLVLARIISTMPIMNRQGAATKAI